MKENELKNKVNKVLELKIKILNKEAILPSYQRNGDAGFDLYAVEETELKAKERKTLPLGIAGEIPPGWYVAFGERSGHADRNGLQVLAGTIDSNYRGEWKVILLNSGEEDYVVKKGERIAQGILKPAPQAKITIVENLSPSERGEAGFGSSGK